MYKIYEIPYFSEDVNVSYYKIRDMDEFVAYTDAEKEIVEKINILNEDVCRYLNKTYNVSWKTDKLNVFKADVTEYLKFADLKYCAIYINGSIFVNRDFSLQNDSIQNEYIISHEILHYLFEINSKKKGNFCLLKDDKTCGEYFEEAIVDTLAKKYMLSKYDNLDKIQLTSGYKYIRMYVELIELGQPNFMNYLLNDDFDGLQKNFNKHAKQHVKCEGDAFEKWLSLLDQTIMSSYDEDDLSQNISTVLSFTAVNTPKKESELFVNIVQNITGDQVEEFKNYMY